jgi:hypothetical protein
MRRLAFVLVVLALMLTLSSARTATASVVGRQLSTQLPELKFQGVTFSDAVDFLRDVSGANIIVNWKALEAAGVTRDAPVNLHLNGVSLHKAMDLLLTEAAGGDTITYVVDQGVIEITTRELADKNMVTRVYPVEDLLMIIPDFNDAPQFSLDAAQNGGGGGGSPVGQGGGGGAAAANPLFQQGGTQTAEVVKTKAERAQELVELIEQVVSPDIWKDNGGTASLRYYNGMLVVTAPRSIQEAIGGEYD